MHNHNFSNEGIWRFEVNLAGAEYEIHAGGGTSTIVIFAIPRGSTA